MTSELAWIGGEVAGSVDDGPFPGVRRRTSRSEKATIASYVFGAGAVFPTHRHDQEQITVILSGEVEFNINGDAHRLQAGQTFVVAPDVEHGLRAGPSGASFLAIVVPPRARADAYELTQPPTAAP
ncbi:MAG: cupin domain-containing protein [Solirubrobacteraceae bacterium]